MRAVPQFANIYAEHLNAFWVNTLGRLSSLFGFSVVEFLIYLLIILAVILVVRVIRGNIIRLGNGKIYGKDELLLALLLASVIFFLFECNQDMYFYRTTFSKTYGIGQGSYTTDELETVCRMLAENVNALSTEVTRNEDGLMQCDADIRNRTRLAMTALGEKYPYLGGWFPKAKPVTVSELLSYSNMTGIYSAYTIEANYNTDMTPYNIPYTMCHELSHLKGVMQENQANFCAYRRIRQISAPISHARTRRILTFCTADILWRGYIAEMSCIEGITTGGRKYPEHLNTIATLT